MARKVLRADGGVKARVVAGTRGLRAMPLGGRGRFARQDGDLAGRGRMILAGDIGGGILAVAGGILRGDPFVYPAESELRA